MRNKGVIWLSINSSDPSTSYYFSGQEMNKFMQEKRAMPTAVILDSQGMLGHTYGAQTTPHMFIIDSKGILVYAGAIDNNDSIKEIGDVNYVLIAIDELLAGKEVSTSITKPYGCTIRYTK